MLAPAPWFKRLSKIVLECTPVAAALLIGVYLLVSHDWSKPPANALAVQPSAQPGEMADAAALITSTHASLVPGKVTPPVIEPRERIVETPPPPEPKLHAAHKPATTKSAQRPAPAPAGTRVAATEPAADRGVDLRPAPGVEPIPVDVTEAKPEEKKSWGRRFAEATYLKDAADMTVNASMTVARVSVDTFDKVASAAGSLIPDFRK